MSEGISFSDINMRSETCFHRVTHMLSEKIATSKYKAQIPVFLVFFWLSTTNLGFLVVSWLELYPLGYGNTTVAQLAVGYWLCTAMIVFLHLKLSQTHPGPVDDFWKQWGSKAQKDKGPVPAYAAVNQQWEERDRLQRAAHSGDSQRKEEQKSEEHIAIAIDSADEKELSEESESVDAEVKPLIEAGLLATEGMATGTGMLQFGSYAPSRVSLAAPPPIDASDDSQSKGQRGTALHSLLQNPALRGLDINQMMSGDVMRINPSTGTVEKMSDASSVSSMRTRTQPLQRRGKAAATMKPIAEVKDHSQGIFVKGGGRDQPLYHYSRDDGEQGHGHAHGHVHGQRQEAKDKDIIPVEHWGSVPPKLLQAMSNPQMGFVMMVDGDVDFQDIGNNWDKVSDFKTYHTVAKTKDRTVKVTNTETGEEMLVNPSDYCITCHQWKPARVHHCSSCGRCVARMDHHCIWISNCVGVATHRFFIQYLVYHCVFTLVSGCYALYVMSALPSLHWAWLLACFQLLWDVAIGFFVSNLLQWQLRLISTEVTQLEYLFERHNSGKFSKGTRFDNLHFYLGPTLLHTFLPID